MSSVQELRAKFLLMSQQEKRQFYEKESYTEVNNIEVWDEFFQKNKDRLKQQFNERFGGGKSLPSTEKVSVNPELNSKVCLWKGDITLLEIDAIVNAANTKMLGAGGGVDGTIHRAAGPLLLNECRTLNGCETGSAKITAGYELPARYIIHTVGPRGECPNKLQSCYETCLRLLVENNLRSVAFPCISTGVYCYPQVAAANVALKTVRSFLEKSPKLGIFLHEDSATQLILELNNFCYISYLLKERYLERISALKMHVYLCVLEIEVDRVVFCLFLQEDVLIYENLMQVYFPVDEIKPNL